MCGMFDDNGGADGGWPSYMFREPVSVPRRKQTFDDSNNPDPCNCPCHRGVKLRHSRPCCDNHNKLRETQGAK